MPQANQFDATPSVLGYIYQIRYALLLALRKIHEVDDPDNCIISIESLDDISFEDADSVSDLIQAKHHLQSGNITDRSPDFWKTIRVWSELINDQGDGIEGACFSLITTESVPQNSSIVSCLSPDKSVRNCSTALEHMRNISDETTSSTNKKAYEAFSQLEPSDQDKLVNSIYILGDSSGILDVEKEIKKSLRLTISENHVDAFFTRLEGEWNKLVIEAMVSDGGNDVALGTVMGFVDDLRSQFLPGNLPADYDSSITEDIDLINDNRLFIEQLRLIGANDKVLLKAIENYHKSFLQRSRWSRDGLLLPGELKKYTDKLKNEWENQQSLVELDGDLTDMKAGQELYRKCQTTGALSIRKDFASLYVARGTYHQLSNDLGIGWHPNYKDLLPSNDDQGAA